MEKDIENIKDYKQLNINLYNIIKNDDELIDKNIKIAKLQSIESDKFKTDIDPFKPFLYFIKLNTSTDNYDKNNYNKDIDEIINDRIEFVKKHQTNKNVKLLFTEKEIEEIEDKNINAIFEVYNKFTDKDIIKQQTGQSIDLPFDNYSAGYFLRQFQSSYHDYQVNDQKIEIINDKEKFKTILRNSLNRNKNKVIFNYTENITDSNNNTYYCDFYIQQWITCKKSITEMQQSKLERGTLNMEYTKYEKKINEINNTYIIATYPEVNKNQYTELDNNIVKIKEKINTNEYIIYNSMVKFFTDNKDESYKMNFVEEDEKQLRKSILGKFNFKFEIAFSKMVHLLNGYYSIVIKINLTEEQYKNINKNKLKNKHYKSNDNIYTEYFDEHIIPKLKLWFYNLKKYKDVDKDFY